MAKGTKGKLVQIIYQASGVEWGLMFREGKARRLTRESEWILDFAR